MQVVEDIKNGGFVGLDEVLVDDREGRHTPFGKVVLPGSFMLENGLKPIIDSFEVKDRILDRSGRLLGALFPDLALHSFPEGNGLPYFVASCDPDVVQIGKNGRQQHRGGQIGIAMQLPDFAEEIVKISEYDLATEYPVWCCRTLQGRGVILSVGGRAPACAPQRFVAAPEVLCRLASKAGIGQRFAQQGASSAVCGADQV